MAPRNPTADKPATPKPSSDVYTGMLVISLVALLAGCLLLYLDYRRYPGSNPPPITTAAPPGK
jgi:hypothetical protein